MNATNKLMDMLNRCGAVLVRKKKHLVWYLPGGARFVRASTPSDYRADLNNISKLRHSLGDVPQHVEGERRERKRKGNTGERPHRHLGGSFNETMANQLRTTGIVEQSLRMQVSHLEQGLAQMAAENVALQQQMASCWGCWLRRTAFVKLRRWRDLMGK